MKKHKLDEAFISVNGQEIKGADKPSYKSGACKIAIYLTFDNIEVYVNDFQGNEIGGQKRIDILKDILPRVLNKLNEDGK
jgi:hypothetical protein